MLILQDRSFDLTIQKNNEKSNNNLFNQKGMNKKKIKEDTQTQFIKETLRNLPKFYLVGITGHTSFILENLNGIKFKLTIGNQLKCSCNSQNAKHCIHTLYALSQIFYLPNDHHLCYTNNYTDLDLRYIIANRRIHCNKIYDFLKTVKNKVPKHSIIREQDQEDQYDNLCAICQMQIVKRDATTACSSVCGNLFHLECFSQWAKHQIKKSGVVTCPLCRDQKTHDIIMEIKQKEYELKESMNNKKIGLSFNYYCDGCELREISSNQIVYKCIQCEDVTLCQACFKLGRHVRHSFICKQQGSKKWKQCEDRKGKKKYDFDQGLIRMKIPSARRFINFLACNLPCYFSKNTRWNILECKKLEIKIEDLECIACSDKQKAFLRRMHCGHFIHHKCLRKRIQKGRLFCKIDGQKYLLGYASLRKHEQLNKKIEDIDPIQDQSQEEQKEQRKNTSPVKSLRLQKSASFDSKNRIKNNKSLNEQPRSSKNNRSLMSRSSINPQ